MLKYPLGDNSIQTKGERIMLNVNLLSLGLSSSTLYAIIAAGLLIHSILCGAMTSVLLKAKGYSGMVFFSWIIRRSGGNFVRNRNADSQR